MSKRLSFPVVLIILAFIAFLVSVIFISSSRSYGFPNLIDTLLSKIVPPTQKELRTIQKIVTQNDAIVSAVEKSSGGVVSIVTKQVYLDIFRGPVSEELSIGTGFIVDENGLVITNKHVVDDSTATYTVVLPDERVFDVKKIVKDPVNDLAIIKIEASNLSPLEFGDSSKVKAGQSVIAIGNALGRYSNTVTTGVISGIGRGIVAGGYFGPSESLDDVFQTDAALNPGNSGGPLLDLSGEVIGINVAIAGNGENIGFSIPANIAKKTLEGYLKEGKISYPYLGVSYQMITEEMAKFQRLPIGAFIENVISGSGADKAGIQRGDIIKKIDGVGLSSRNTLSKVIRAKKVSDSVSLTLDRAGKEINLKVTLSEAENQ